MSRVESGVDALLKNLLKTIPARPSTRCRSSQDCSGGVLLPSLLSGDISASVGVGKSTSLNLYCTLAAYICRINGPDKDIQTQSETMEELMHPYEQMHGPTLTSDHRQRRDKVSNRSKGPAAAAAVDLARTVNSPRVYRHSTGRNKLYLRTCPASDRFSPVRGYDCLRNAL
jgi:hypothetical protein